MGRAAKGAGSVVAVKGGYRGYITVNKKRVYTKVYKTKTLADNAKQELRNKRANGTLTTGKVQTVEQWMNHWMTIAKLRPKTEAFSRWIIDKRIAPHLGATKLDELTVEQIEQWINGLGVSPSSQRRYLSPLETALNVAVRRKRISFNPAAQVSLEPQGRADTTAFSREDREAILAAATGWNRARWHIGLRIGLRPAEVLGLAWPDFDEAAGTITIRNQLLYAKGHGVYLQPAPKTRAGERTIILPKSLVRMLSEHHVEQLVQMAKVDDWEPWQFNGQPVALIFTQKNGRPVGDQVDRREWSRLLTAAGLPHTRRYTARHTAATHMLADSGGDVAVTAKNLGHTDPAFTYKTYVHPLEQAERDLAERMDAPYRAPYEGQIVPSPAQATALNGPESLA